MVIEILIENLGFGSMLKTSDFPMELFPLIGEDYIKNYKVGSKYHQKRMELEINIPEKLKGIYFAN